MITCLPPTVKDSQALPALHIGLGGWGCWLTADTSAGRAALAHWFGRYQLADFPNPQCEIRLSLRVPERPTITLRDGPRFFDFSDVAAGPEWRRFTPVSDARRQLLADQMMGPRPMLELHGDFTTLLQPTLWPLYVSVAWQWLMLRDRSLCCVHAAITAYRERALALIGPSGAGKSTLSRALQTAGADYYGDDGAYFSVPDYRLYPLPRDLCLRPGGLKALGAQSDEGTWYELKQGDPKYLLRTETAGHPCPSAPVTLIFLDGFTERPELRPMAGGEAARRLFSQMAYGASTLTERLKLAGDLADRYPCYRLAVGVPRETAELLLHGPEAP
jgi:hypothetical protein